MSKLPEGAPGVNTPSDPVQGAEALDLEALRLSQSFIDAVGLKRHLVSMRVRKPHRQEFIRVHPGEDFHFETALLTLKHEPDGTYLVAPGLWDGLWSEIVPTTLVLAASRQGAAFIWPLRLPRSDGRQDLWAQSAMEAAGLAEKKWISVRANLSLGAYEAFEALGDLPNPEWPDLTLEEAIRLAFKNRYIDKPEHPILRRLRGEV